MMAIDPSTSNAPRSPSAADVSVVIQGPWHPTQTRQSVESVIRVLPGAEIIVSCWKDDPVDLTGLTGVRLLLNDDPGAVDLRGVLTPDVERRSNIVLSNFNRQIVSTRNGLAAATRPYALKLRSDMTLEHAGFMDFAALFAGAPAPDAVFKQRIVATNARSPHRSFCFFVQDFVFFGLLDDMRLLADAKLFPGRDELLAMDQEARDALVLVPEQQWLLSAFRRRFDIPMRNALQNTPKLATLSERLIACNFVCLDIRRFGAKALKESLAWVNEPGDIRYTWLWLLKASFAEYLQWCRTHCGDDFQAIIDRFPDEFKTEIADLPIKGALIVDHGGLNPEGLLWLGEKSHREGKLEQAWNAYTTLLRARYDHFRLYYDVGVLQIQSGAAAAGVANIKAALEKAPDFIPAYEALAQHADMTGATAEAAEWREKAARAKASP
jgi:tetratricopeptide (TPR) repeat protein